MPGYTGNKEIANVLLRLQLGCGEAQIGANLHRCYEALVATRVFPSAELELVELWLENLRSAARRGERSAKSTSVIESIDPE